MSTPDVAIPDAAPADVPRADGPRADAARAARADTLGGALTRTPLLARNVALNLAGWVVPVALALVAVPVLARRYDAERFGILNLAWTAVGYFALLDLGLGRAVTQLLAERFGRGKSRAVGEVVWTAALMLLPVALLAAGVAWVAADRIASGVLGVGPALHGEAVATIRLLAVAMPFTVLTTLFRGVLEAGQRFGAINLLRVPLGVLTFAAPLATLPFTRSVAAAVAVLMIGRAALCVGHAWACARAFPSLRRFSRLRGVLARRLVSVGGWMTVSNVVNPVLVSVDRVVVGAALGVAAVGYYATPQEIVTKMWLVTSAVLPVLFPAVSATFGRDPARTALLFDRAARVMWATLLPVAFLLTLLARETLAIWLGPDFARAGATALQVLAAAVFFNCMGQTAFTVLQAVGRPRVTALSHVAQLPVFLAALLWATPRWGLVGAAVVWSARVVVDSAIAFAAVAVLLPGVRPAARRAAAYTGVAMLCVLAAMLPQTLLQKGALLAVAAPLYALMVWARLLTPSERALLRARLRLRAA